MKFRQSTYFRVLAFLTLVLCAPMNVLAAGPYVWCVGPHDHAVIESKTTEAHHSGHHHDITDPMPARNGSHDNEDDCIDLALGQEGQLNAFGVLLLVPDLIELPQHLSSIFAPSSRICPLTFGIHGPPEIGAFPAQPLIIQHAVILLI